ncbi:MAG: carboxypeptidase-like regulatory domain-containing protein, partial [Acidobacteria bacterium]|nr:carboxypeptidase-like regulatory domain-containing protein [Acidobacteriota bacterium]
MALILVACLLAGSAQAQVRGTGASGYTHVSGTVTDPDGKLLAGVTLFLNSTETKVKNTKVKTNKKGRFVHPLVNFGPYTFEFVKEGYKVYYL